MASLASVCGFVLLEQTKLLDAEFKYLIIFFNLSKINFANFYNVSRFYKHV